MLLHRKGTACSWWLQVMLAVPSSACRDPRVQRAIYDIVIQRTTGVLLDFCSYTINYSNIQVSPPSPQQSCEPR